MSSYTLCKVKSILPLGRGRVINLTVNKNHTFVTGNGIVTHNCDRLSSSAQDSLKATMEQFAGATTRFIMTSNNKQKIIAPIMSRSTMYDFTMTTDERNALIPIAFKRIATILKAENIEYDPKSVASLVQKHYPDMRKTLNEIQRYSSNGKIDAGILIQENTTTDELIGFLKNKKFGDVRKWLARNPDLDHQLLLRHFYDNLTELFTPQTIPEVILILSQYQYYASRVVDQEINTMACLIEMVKGSEWK
jgi:replication factor C small subunit